MAEALIDDPVYVAVSTDVSESRLTLTWALRHLQPKKLYLLHVHQPISINPTSSGLEQSEIDAIQESELTSSYEILLKYRDICAVEGILEQDVDISYSLANNVGEGIVELIYENNIKKLIMGAAADSHNSEDMVNITSRKFDYVTKHAPHCCKIWLVGNGNLIHTREGRFDRRGSPHPSSESLTSLQGLDSALVPYEEAVRGEHDNVSHALSSPEDQSARGFETMYYEEQRRGLEIEERRIKAEEDLRAEIENMKGIQKELEEQLYIDCPRQFEMFQRERDEAMKTTVELLRLLNLDNSESASHSPSSSFQRSVSNEPPPYFLCPITQEVMREPSVAADGHTYEAEALREWLHNGHDTSPMTNLKLAHHHITSHSKFLSHLHYTFQIVSKHSSTATIQRVKSITIGSNCIPQTEEGGASRTAIGALVSTGKTRTKLSSEEDAAIIPEGCAATAATPKECPVLVRTRSSSSARHSFTVSSRDPVRSNDGRSSVAGTQVAAQNIFLHVQSYKLYEATSSRKNRSLGMELASATVASVFLGFGSLFLLLASGVYV
uniref:RING-type E3 ubiquitin transferase n=1 Tax=Brassica campestris TaxID=3711 RepID=M4D1G8_BRACM